MATYTTPKKRFTRSSAAAEKQCKKTPRNEYGTESSWCVGFVVAAGIEGSEDLSLVNLIKAAAKDGTDLEAMRPKDLSKADKGKRDKAWDRTYRSKLREGGAELKKLLTSCSNVLALHNHSELQTHAATLAAHGIDIKTLYGKVDALDGEVKIQGAQISNVVNRVGNLEELVKGGDQRSHSTKAPVDFVPPSTDKKPPADDRETKQPSPISSPRNLLTTFNGGSTGDGVGVSKTAAPAATAPSGISIADLPLDDESFFAEYYRAHPEKVDAVLSAAFAAAEPFMESDDDDDGDDGDDDDGSDDSSTGRYGVPEAVRGLVKGISKVAQSQADQVQAQVATQEQVNTLRRQVNTLEHQQRAKNGGGFFGGLFSDA